MNKQVKLGAIISYVLIILNATYGLFLTPFIVDQLGDSSYGVYKTISALTSSFMVLDSGVGATIMRYVAKYRAEKKDDEIPNFLSMGVIQTTIVCSIVAIITTVAYFFLDIIYGKSLTTSELSEAKILYVFLALGMIAHMVENFINGIISGYNQFAFANGARVIRLLLRILAIVLFLSFIKSSLVLVIIDLAITIVFIFIELVYLHFKLNVRIKYDHFDGSLFKESFIYIILMFLSSTISQVNGNLSNVFIGAMISAASVTIYSMASLIFTMYMNLATAISGVMLPTVTQTLNDDDDKYTKTIDLVVKTGRIQFLLLGAVAMGFFVLGIPFIEVWLGRSSLDVYYLTLIMLIPALFELCINVCLSILRAKNMIGFRTVVMACSAAVNIAIILVFMPYIGYYAAAIATAFSFFFGSVVTMGIYYYKKLGINVLKIYKRIFGKIWICIIISGVGSYFSSLLVKVAWHKLLVGIPVFCVIYAIMLLLFGLTREEKQQIPIIKKYIR